MAQVDELKVWRHYGTVRCITPSAQGFIGYGAGIERLRRKEIVDYRNTETCERGKGFPSAFRLRVGRVLVSKGSVIIEGSFMVDTAGYRRSGVVRDQVYFWPLLLGILITGVFVPAVLSMHLLIQSKQFQFENDFSTSGSQLQWVLSTSSEQKGLQLKQPEIVVRSGSEGFRTDL